MRILHVLILLGGLLGVFMVYNDYANKEKKRRNVHTEQVRMLIADTVKSTALKGDEDFTHSDDATVFRILAMMHQAEGDGYSSSDTALQAASSSGARGSVAKMIAERLNENYATAKKLGVFEDLNNMLRMDRGLQPTAHAKGWEDQRLTTGHVLSPLVAPEASRSLANVVVMPEIVRNMQTEDLGGFSFEQSKKWLAEGLITLESHQAVVAILDHKAKKGL
jgi:hypothetical protein